MRNINVYIRPVSGKCAGSCAYCAFNSGEAVMDTDTLCSVVDKATMNSRGNVSFTFTGGEPLLAGRRFFEDFVSLEKRMLGPGQRSRRVVKTDGSLMDDAWAFFFAQNDFTVELSADGSRETHERYRGSGSYSAVKNAVALLNAQGAEVYLSCVLTRETAGRPVTVYRALKELNADGMSFTPCLSKRSDPWALEPKRYEAFLKKLFDLWWTDRENGDFIKIRLFDDAMRRLAGLGVDTCALNGSCEGTFTVDGDGSVYPCPCFASPKNLLGNISTSDFNKMFESPAGRAFYEIARELPEDCRECAFTDICTAGCRRDRAPGGMTNYYCGAMKWFFEYAENRLRRAAKEDYSEVME